MTPQEPLAGSTTARTRHVAGRQWPACGCRLCLDDYICPAAVARAGRALVLVAALGALGVVVSSL